MQQDIQLLQKAAMEIKNLRHQNELMRARLDMFDDMMYVLNTVVTRPSQGMSLDLVWEIEKHIQSNMSEAKKADSSS